MEGDDDSEEQNEFSDELETPGSGLKLTLHGVLFQLKILMLFLWRAKQSVSDFRFATEYCEAEKFDDIVYQYKKKKESKWTLRLFQAKHKEGITTEEELEKIKEADLLTDDEKGAFSLQKYFHSFIKIKKKTEEKSKNSFFSESEIEDLVIITNTGFGSTQLKKNFSKINLTDDVLLTKDAVAYKLKVNSNLVKKLKPILVSTSDFYRLVEELADVLISQEKQIKMKGIFKDYHYSLIKHVFEKINGKLVLQEDFINERSQDKLANELSKALKKEIAFRQINVNENENKFEKIFEEFDKFLKDTSTINKLAQKLVQSYKNQSNTPTLTRSMEHHNVLATEVINPKTQKFFTKFINPDKNSGMN